MSRTSRVPCHQNVYDLLGIEPAVCPDAARMIAEHEAAHGPLPASVREWYSVPNVVPLTAPNWSSRHGTLWYDYSNMEQVPGLDRILAAIGTPIKLQRRRFARILVENQGCNRWYIRPDRSDDPSVWADNDRQDDFTAWEQTAARFSDFLSEWFGKFYRESWTPISRNGEYVPAGVSPLQKPYQNGLWLRTPAEPFAVPVIDFLAEQFGEPERTPREGDVATYTWRPDGGTLRLTADDPAHPDPLSAWWVHAVNAEQLAAFARLLRPWGTLARTLRADTEESRAVWGR